MSKRVCHECHGKGWVKNWAEACFFTIATAGLVPFFDALIMHDIPQKDRMFNHKCPECKGRGYTPERIGR